MFDMVVPVVRERLVNWLSVLFVVTMDGSRGVFAAHAGAESPLHEHSNAATWYTARDQAEQGIAAHSIHLAISCHESRRDSHSIEVDLILLSANQIRLIKNSATSSRVRGSSQP